MPEDVYTHGHDESVLRNHRRRRAADSAAYLLGELRPGMSLLDVGCGPGSITVDLARLVAPGRAVGLDRAGQVLTEARKAASEAGADNLEVVAGDVYALPYAAASFDVVHAHQLLQHLSDPVAALREMGRVAGPQGLLAVREADYAGFLWYPLVPELGEFIGVYRAVARSNGAEPDAGRRLLAWARAADLRDIRVSAGIWCFATPEERAWWAGTWAERCLHSAVATTAVERGLATPGDLERLAAGWHTWAADDDAWFAVPHGQILARGA